MSGRTWRLADVAMVKCSDGEWRRASYAEPTFDQPAWVFEDNSRRRVAESDARPLVVIDPEDREQVERLWDAMEPQWRTEGWQWVQAALREFADPKPPKPEEPTGLGAVVEDGGGLTWVRVPLRSNPARWFSGNTGDWSTWDAIEAPKVLSEGVPS